MDARCPSCCPDRREFLKKAGALAAAGLAVAVPAGAGLALFLDPLRQKGATGGWVQVASLEALPADGTPKDFTVSADLVDAWNRYLDVPIGAVYLRRLSPNQVQALNVVCPHAGCFVNYLAQSGQFRCPCHNSRFALDGRLADPASPSPRPMDSLPVEIRNQTEVWVKFQNFRAGQPEKIPAA